MNWNWISSDSITTNHTFSFFLDDTKRIGCLHERISHGCRPLTFLVPFLVVSSLLERVYFSFLFSHLMLRLDFKLRNGIRVVGLAILFSNLPLHGKRVWDTLKCYLRWSVHFNAKQQRAPLFGFKNARFFCNDVQNGIVAHALIDEGYVNCSWQLFVHI